MLQLQNTNMTSFTETMCTYFISLYRYFKTFWPLSIIYGPWLKKPSSQTERLVLQAIQCLITSSDNKTLFRLIDEFPQDEDVFVMTDNQDGFNIMQHAVIRKRKDCVYLLYRKYKLAALLHHQCSPPLHIASFCGYTGIVKFLLEKGAKCEQVAGMCYPNPHQLVYYEQRFYIFFRQITYPCQKKQFSAIECAIIADQVECLKVLLETLDVLPAAYLMQFSCRYGSKECVKYFLEHYPDTINECNDEEETPLHLSVTWGIECVKILLDNGADVQAISKYGETALHRLYRTDLDGLFSIYNTTKYLLTNGLEQDINKINGKGETALHVLVTHISYIGGSLVANQLTTHREDLQEDYQEQVVHTIAALLEFNADPLAVNALGLQPLTKLYHMALRTCHPTDMASCIDLDVRYQFKNDFGALMQAARVLLKHGADSNSQCPQGHSPLVCLLECLLCEDKSAIVKQADDFLENLSLLLENSANPNLICSDKATSSTLLAKIGERYFTSQSSINKEFALFVNKVLVLMLKHGLNPNHTTCRRSPNLSGGTGNALIDFVRLSERVLSTDDFQIVHMWLKTLLQWGADPDIEPYPSEPIICHSQSSIFLKKQGTQAVNHYIHEVKDSTSMFSGGHAKELLLLFYNTMDHQELYTCLNTAKFMARFHPLGATGRDFLNVLSVLSENPRTLKQNARVSIYKSVNREIAAKTELLPLPKSLKLYLSEIE